MVPRYFEWVKRGGVLLIGPSLFGVGEVEQQVNIWNSRTQENRSVGYG
jgi:hypothetical protein